MINEPLVVEYYLTEIFKLIPARTFTANNVTVNVPNPTYDFGDVKNCNALIKRKGGNIYPLIYQTSTQETQNPKAGTVTTDIELVIATREEKVSLLNTERWAASYNNILMPLVKNIYQALNESGIVEFDNTYELDKRPNYSETEANTANTFIDIVDAVIFRAKITIKNRPCLNKNIKFNN